MFADPVLAHRIDCAEARLSAAVARRQPDDVRALVQPMSGGLAVYAGPASPMTKVIGGAIVEPLDLAALEAVEREWRDRGEAVRIELAALAGVDAAAALGDRGYRLRGFETVLGLALDLPLASSSAALSGIDVRPIAAADRSRWLEIAATASLDQDGSGRVADDGFSRAALERVLVDFAAVDGMRQYLAFIDGEPVGEASLRIDRKSGLAQFAGAATLAPFRGRGVQKALVARRIADARAAGCDLAVVTTAPGTRSQANVMRRGFEVLYARAILVKRADGRVGFS